MPQVVQDKRRFSIKQRNRQKNTFMCEQVCVCDRLRMLVCLSAEADTQAALLKRQ